MFDSLFPKHWTTLQRLMWLKTNALARAVYETITGNPVSFSARSAPLRQLSVAFSPVQAGSGDPSPDNVRPISGWSSLTVYHSGADTSNPQTISISLGDTYYSGTLDVVTGVLTVDTLYKALTGAETVQRQSQSGGAYYRFNVTGVISNNPAGYAVIPKFCSHFKPISYTQLPNQDNSIARFQYDTTAYIRCDTYTSAADFKAFLAEQYAAGTPVQIGSPIATPIPISLTPQEVQSLLGVNNMWSDSNGDLTVTYRSN